MGCNKGCNSNNNKTLVFLERVCYNITIDNDGGTIMSEKKKRGQGEWSFSQRKDGLWTGRIDIGTQENGKRKIKAVYGKTEQEVKRKLKELKKELIKNDYQEVKKQSVRQYMT